MPGVSWGRGIWLSDIFVRFEVKVSRRESWWKRFRNNCRLTRARIWMMTVPMTTSNNTSSDSMGPQNRHEEADEEGLKQVGKSCEKGTSQTFDRNCNVCGQQGHRASMCAEKGGAVCYHYGQPDTDSASPLIKDTEVKDWSKGNGPRLGQAAGTLDGH